MHQLSDLLITLFESIALYSSHNGLGDHLRGLDVLCTDFTGQSTYNTVFIALFAINSVSVVNYYYALFNRVPFNVWWKWLVNILASALLVAIIAFISSNNDLTAGNFCSDLRMGTADCMGFAITSFIFSLVWCCMLSATIKWWSSVNRKVPF